MEGGCGMTKPGEVGAGIRIVYGLWSWGCVCVVRLDRSPVSGAPPTDAESSYTASTQDT